MNTNGARCTHGLKAGNCNTCPAVRDADTNRWTWVAEGKGRTRMVGGRKFRVNRHGVELMVRDGYGDGFDGFYDWPGHGVIPRGGSDDAGREFKREIRAALASAGLRATCAPSGACGCAPRF